MADEMTKDGVIRVLEETFGPAPSDFLEAIKEDIDPELNALRDRLLVATAELARGWFELGQKVREKREQRYVN